MKTVIKGKGLVWVAFYGKELEKVKDFLDGLEFNSDHGCVGLIYQSTNDDGYATMPGTDREAIEGVIKKLENLHIEADTEYCIGFIKTTLASLEEMDEYY